MRRKLLALITAAALTLTSAAAFPGLTEASQNEVFDTETAEEMTSQTGTEVTAAEEAATKEAAAEEAATKEADAEEAAAEETATEKAAAEEAAAEEVAIEKAAAEEAVTEETVAQKAAAEAADLQADGNDVIAEITSEDGELATFSSFAELRGALGTYANKTFTIKICSNISLDDCFVIPDGCSATLDLNGFSLNRHKASAEYNTDSNWEAMIVNSGAKLTIIDSNPDRWHGGYLEGNTSPFQIWFENDGSTAEPIYGGIIAGGASDNGAGGITIKSNAVVTMKGGTIAGNISYDGGGGVQLRESGSRFILDGGKIIYNGAWREKGGGIKAQNGTVEIISGDVSHNWAHAGLTVDGDGGGIYINQEDERALYIHGDNTSANGEERRTVNISDNYAEDEGGAIYIDEGTSTILNAAIENNKANDGDGGGILINDDGTSASLTAVTGCYIHNNTARDGGGIAITDENYVQIANCVITNNTAGDEGGGVYFNAYGDGCNMTGCTVTGNEAARNGGGVYLYDTVALGGKMIVKDNTARDGRNNLYNYGYLTNPNLKINDLAYDSELYIHSDWSNDQVITEGTTIGSAKGMYGEGDYHFEKINDPASSDYRKIVQRAGKGQVQTPEAVKVWDLVNQDPSAEASNLGHTMKIDESKAPVNNAPVYEGYLRYSDQLQGTEGFYHTLKYYYSDGLFFNDPAEYDKHLASLTAAFSLSSGSAAKGRTTISDPSTQKNRFNYLTQAFSDIGCTNESMYVNDCYQRKPETDTMGVAMANKTIYKDEVRTEENAYLLIPIFVRSYNYGPEWVSNLTIGDGSDNNGEAKGFSASADIVMADLDTYIKNHPEVQSAISKGRAIFWMGGYSRGGAVINIAAKRVTDQFAGGEAGTETGNTVFAYCKAAAQGGIEGLDKKGGYLNIHNIINKSDVVTYTGPGEMGFKRYGVDHYLPGGAAGEVSAVTKTYGRNDDPMTIYSDNKAYEVDYNSNDYLQLRSKMLSQLAAIMPNNEFNDYFHAATVNYFWGNPITSWVPILGEDMITETDDASLATKEKFCQELIARALKYSGNSLNAGHAWGPQTGDLKDYRDFYAKETKLHFMPDSKYNKQGSATFEETFGTLCMIAMGGEKPLDLSNMADITGAATDIALDAYDELIGDLYTDNTAEEYTAWIDKVWNLLNKDLTEEQKAKGYQNLRDILGDDIDQAESVYPTLLALVFDLINDDYNETGQNLIGTAAYNAADLANEHVVNIAWIRADDDWYAEDVNTVYDMKVDESAPEAPQASIGASAAEDSETAITEGETAKAQAGQKLYLRTQPGGAVYYTMTVDGEETVSDRLYQELSGIELPANATVRVTAYAMAYEQKGPEAVYTIEVAEIPVESIEITPSSVEINTKSSHQLEWTILPADATNKNVIWTSSNEKAATVDSDGKVTALTYGKAVITATTEDGGKTASCSVQTRYHDVSDKGKYWYTPVYWAADSGITNGFEGGVYFGPELNCTREQMITFLYRQAGTPAVSAADIKKYNTFKDVAAGAYYEKAVVWAAKYGITKGYSSGEYAGKFGVGLDVTREDTVTFLHRAAGKPSVTAADIKKYSFPDVPAGKYYANAIVWAAKKGITKGYSSGEYAGKFGVGLNVLRGDLITFLYRYNNL